MGVNKRLKLMWYCKATGKNGKAIWRRFPAIIDGEGHRREARVGWVIDYDQLTHYPDGKFQVRSWENGKQVYQTLNAKHGRDAVLLWESVTRRAVNAAKLASGERKRLQTIKDAAAAYASDLERENKLEAAEIARFVLKEFESVCPSLFIKMISRDHILRYHASLRKKKRSERTIANRHNRIKSFLRWCKVDTSFMPDAPKFEKRTSPTIYNPEQVDAIRAAAENYRDGYMRLAIDMALMLGLRDQELAYACWTDVDFHHSTFRVTGKPDLGFAVKDAEERLLPIPSELLSRLRERHAEVQGSRLVLGTRSDASNGHLLRSLKRLAQKAGLNCGQCRSCRKHEPNEVEDRSRMVVRKVDPKSGQQCAEWTLHKFRRTYLTTLLRQGVDARTVKEFAGHSDLDTTLKYLAPASSDEMQVRINAIKWGSGNGINGRIKAITKTKKRSRKMTRK